MIKGLVLWLCAVWISALSADRAAAQSITIDPASAVEAAASTVNMNHTVSSGSNRLLIVSVAIERETRRVTAITYAGQALAFVGTSVDPTTSARVEVWRLIAPATGTNTVSVTFNASASVVVAAISFANVHQTTPIAASQFATGDGSLTASASVASATNQVILAAIAADDAVNTLAPGAGQASRWNLVNAADVIGAGSTRPGLASSTTMSYTFGDNKGWAMGLVAIQPVPAFLVTNTNDSGPGSLREAVNAANANSGANTISFAIPGTGPHTITLFNPLPPFLGNGDAIDGTTQPGSSCGDLWAGTPPTLRVRLNAGSIGTGLHLEAANLLVRGLSITGFTNKVYIHPFASNVTIRCNYIGLLPDGTRGSGTSPGVLVEAPGTVIGGLNPGEGNVISGNSFAVWTFNGSTNTAVRGNFIGTNPAGTSAIANERGINHINGSGTWRDITRNLIAGNTFSEISVDSDDVVSGSNGQILIQRNVIGFNRTQTAKLQAGSASAILFSPGSISNVLIGGDAGTQGNVIGGLQTGIQLSGVSNITIQGNTIGGNGGNGVLLDGGASGITILGNTIGTPSVGGGLFANGGLGIFMSNVSNIAVGDGTPGGRNLIAGNRRRAIQAVGNTADLAINGNYIGTDSSGNLAVANGQDESAFSSDAITLDANASFTNVTITNNVIGGYGSALIDLWSSTGSGLTIQGNRIGVGADGVSQIVSGNTEGLIWSGGGSNWSNVLIGGDAPGQGNVMAFGARNGITIDNAGSNVRVIGNTIRNNTQNGITVVGNARASILANRIFANGQLGIDLNANGVTANDAGDGDTGPNELVNFPAAIRAVVTGANQITYNFTLDAPAALAGYRIEFFASSAADPAGFGEGERYLGHVDITHGGGAQSYAGTLTTLEPVSIGAIISATTTRRTAGGAWDITSEFSAVATADGVAALAVALASEVFDPPPGNPFATPGNDILLTTTVSNGGTGSTDADSLFVAVAINPAHAFLNGVTAALGGVIGFHSSASTLSFTPATDLRFSSSAAAPTSFAQCTYTPAAGYDPQVRHLCLNPKGSLPSGLPQGQFAVQIRVRID